MTGGPGGSPPSGDSGGVMFNAENMTGISLNSLLDKANPADSATNVTFIGTNGRVETVSLADIRAQQDAAIVIMGTGMLQAIIPGTGAGTMISIAAIIVS
jgi:DMSO/TMAO reductase YedYZ molybdopterin-dependent catalytic subunit